MGFVPLQGLSDGGRSSLAPTTHRTLVVKPVFGAPFSHPQQRHVAVSFAGPAPCCQEAGSATPVGLAPGPRARPPKRPRRAGSALDPRRSGGRAPRTGRPVHRSVRVVGPGPVGIPSNGSHASVYTPRGAHLAAEAVRWCDQHPRLPVGWPGAFKVCPELKS